MLAFLPLITSLLPLLLNELAQFKVISPSLAALIGGIETAAQPLITDASTASPVTITTILTAISSALAVLKAQTTLSPLALLVSQALTDAIAAGLAASNVTSIDPAALHPETPLTITEVVDANPVPPIA